MEMSVGGMKYIVLIDRLLGGNFFVGTAQLSLRLPLLSNDGETP